MLKKHLQQKIENVVGLKENPVNFLEPAGDKGLFGPTSMVWKIHGDFSSMLVGGITALYLQMIHPKVLAGVWDHSNFRTDLSGRLKRTAQFVSVVSFGPTAEANLLLKKIAFIHQSVMGVTEQGEAYAANDPELLLWVHATQCFGYLQAHQRYHSVSLTDAQIAQYFDEYKSVLIALGGEDIHWYSWSDLMTYLESQIPILSGGNRVDQIYNILQAEAQQGQKSSLAGGLFLNAALDLVPRWGQSIFDYSPTVLGIESRTKAVRLFANLLRWASMESAAKQARIRTSTKINNKEMIAEKDKNATKALF